MLFNVILFYTDIHRWFGNDKDVISMTDVVFLRYMSEGIIHSGTLAIEFEHSSSHCSINYLDVQYGDP